MERTTTTPVGVNVRGGIRVATLLAVAAGTVASVQAARAQIEGAQVARGSAAFQSSNGRTVITAANNTVINYTRFDIGAGQTVQFVQPTADARVLNRISSSSPTRIDGSLLANGRVYLVNPAGVVFGKNAIVDAARFVAAASKMSDGDFLRGDDRFTGVSGSVVNEGRIGAGSVHLIGRVVENHGSIVAQGGVVTMLSGNDVLLREQGSRVSVRIDGKDLEASATGGTGAMQVVSRSEMRTQSTEASGTMSGPTAGGAGRRFSSLGAGSVLSVAFSGAAVKNTGSIHVGGGAAVLGAPTGDVRNVGVISADVPSGTAGEVIVHGRDVVHSGEISAVAEDGQSGRVVVTSTHSTMLGDGSRTSVAGGDGVADAGTVLVHSYNGSTMFAPGAVIDLSGGAEGGNAGYAEVSAVGALGFRGVVLSAHAAGYADAMLYLDPRDVYITSAALHDSELLDGVIAAYETLDDYFVSAEAIEAFLGSVRIEATRDILISQSIHKTNGDLRLDAGRDIIFGVAPTAPCPDPDPCDPKDHCPPRDPCAPPPPPPPACPPQPCNDGGDPKHDGKHDGRPRGRGHVRDCEDDRGEHGGWGKGKGHGSGWGRGGRERDCYDTKHDGKHDGTPRGRGHVGDCDPPPPPPPPCEPPPPPCPPCPPVDCPPPGPIDTITIEANNVTMVAGHSILDQTVSGTHIRALEGEVVLQGTSGVVQCGDVGVPNGGRVEINQGESMVVDGVHNRVLNAESTAVSLKSYNGSITFDTPDGSAQRFGYLNAQAGQDIVINDAVAVGGDGAFYAGEHVQIGAGVASDSGFLLFNSGLNGNGGDVSFTQPGVVIGARDISLIAGGPGIPGDARVDARTNSPRFLGAGGAEGTSPGRFVIAQNATITSEGLPEYAQFGGGLSCDTQYEVQSYAGDVVINDGAPVAHADLWLAGSSAFDGLATGRSVINADLDLCRVTVLGNSTINADVTTEHTQIYTGPVMVEGLRTLTGTQVFFKSTVDATEPGAGGLTINAETIFDANVGSEAALASLTVNGEATLGGGGLGTIDVRTLGDQRFNGPLTLAQDASLASLEGGVIRFGAAVDGPFDLLVRTPGGLVSFGGDVGASRELESLMICTDALEDVAMPFVADHERVLGIPRRATIVGEGDLAIHVGDFAVCTGEKFTVLGSLLLDATNSATLGDVTTVGDMRIVSPSITLLRRPASDLFAVDGSLVEDRGVDFVAGGGIFMEGNVTLGGSDSLPAPRFGSATNTFSENLGAFERREMDPAETSIAALVDELNRVLDQRVPFDVVPPPPPPPLPGQALEDARPRDPMFQDRVIQSVYDVEMLRRIAIAGRGVTIEGALGLSQAFYNDSPTGNEYTPEELQSAATRFDIDTVERLTNLHDSVFGVGAEGEERTGAMRDAIQTAACCYRSAFGTGVFDAHEFAVFTRENGCGEATREHLLSIDRVLSRMREVGLTPVEYIAMRNRLLARLAPMGSYLSVTEVAHAVEAVRLDEAEQAMYAGSQRVW
jgi:filamentous hemagglutinin family protein